nr:hypothetical protein [Tanacetum cinerariifolium]
MKDKSSKDPVIIKAYLSGRQVNRVYMDSRSSYEVIYEHYFLKLKPSIISFRVDSKTTLVGFFEEYSWPLGEVPLEITYREGLLTVTKMFNFFIVRSNSPHNLLLGRTAMQKIVIVVSTIHGAIKFHTPKGIGTLLSKNSPQGPKKSKKITSEARQADKEDILSCVDAKEKIVDFENHNSGSRTFNTKHGVNESKHVEPVKQKKRSLTLKRNEAIHAQVKELIKANILREVKYQTWVSNPVIVKKADGRWKLCIDFTDINKAYPKENHPLHVTESKLENIHQHRFKYFLDAYKGYHQISITDKDEETIAFYTREGVFCYKRFPFRLKIARAPYQRIINKVFACQVGRNMEVNADEMVINCNSKEEMVVDIKETLERIQVINLKLNPNKCSFRVKERRFSIHLIIKQGIKANPSKVKALSDLQPPKSVSEIQSLGKNGRSFSKNERDFRSTTNHDSPVNCKALIVCLAASEEFVSAVLMAERGKKQVHVYFVSQTLYGAELEYPELEKKTHISPRICRKKAAKIFPSSPHPGKKATSQCPIIQANGWNVVLKVILVTMVKVRRSSTGQGHHPRENNSSKAHSLSFVKNSEYSKPSHQSTTLKANGQFSLWLGSCNLDRDKCGNKKNPRFDPKKNEKRHRENLDILEERREVASIKEADYKQKLERCYNKRVRSSTFKPGTYVPRLNSASKAEFQGKMRPTWEGPYVVKKAYGDGAYKLETLSGSLIDRTWNRSNLRKFYV